MFSNWSIQGNPVLDENREIIERLCQKYDANARMIHAVMSIATSGLTSEDRFKSYQILWNEIKD